MAGKKQKPRKRRSHTQHRGVKLKTRERNGSIIHLARWQDPATGKWREVSLTALEKTTDESRTTWAKQKAKWLAEERARIAAGIPVAEPEPVKSKLTEAVENYIKRRTAEGLRAHTLTAYKSAAAEFKTWAATDRRPAPGGGVLKGWEAIEDIDVPALARLRQSIITRPVRAAAAGEKRGKRKPTDKRRHPTTVNSVLVRLGTMLDDLRRLGHLPNLTGDAIRDGLRKVKGERAAVELLRAPELKSLLTACHKHDARRHKLTRAEKAGIGEPGTTPAHDAMGAPVLTCLLTGMRFGELAALEWDWVDLTEGVEAITLPPSVVKTAEARRVDLSISPMLVRLLRALRLQGGTGQVWPWLNHTSAKQAVRRVAKDAAPEGWTWQKLRRSCGSFLACSNIYGSAGPWHAARRLGHSVAVAEARYSRVVAVDAAATTLEAAMGIKAEAEKIIKAVSSSATRQATVAAG